MRYRAETSGHSYNIEIKGAGDALLLLHGFSGDHTNWQDVVTRLQDRFQLIALDILGHGASDKPANPASYRMAAVAADICDLLGQLNITQTHLLGYSMGGRLALFLALKYPDRFRSLTLESAAPGLADADVRAERHRRDSQMAEDIEARGIASFVDYWESLSLWSSQANLPEKVLAAQRQQRMHNDPRGLANSLRGMGSGAQPSLWQELTHLTVATHLIVGELDDKFRRINQQMAERIPGARLTVIPAAGHNTHLENPDAFCSALLSFL